MRFCREPFKSLNTQYLPAYPTPPTRCSSLRPPFRFTKTRAEANRSSRSRRRMPTLPGPTRPSPTATFPATPACSCSTAGRANSPSTSTLPASGGPSISSSKPPTVATLPLPHPPLLPDITNAGSEKLSSSPFFPKVGLYERLW